MDNSQMKHGRKRKFEEDKSVVSILSEAPNDIQIVQFAESRAAEIAALSKACETVGGAKRVFQMLPRHMRRRAMSHNVKRLPRRLQEQAAREYDAQDQKKTISKRPSRRHRRRPKNLLSEYSRRQRTHCWLETHIWHAKRFKMADQWGYRVPVYPSEKSSRACYRATAKHCLLQDLSYLCCIELKGPESLILSGLSHLTSHTIGKTFSAKSSLDGSREGETIMFAFQKYPYDAIGCVTFLWKPVVQSSNSSFEQTDLTANRQLWLWCHPSCYKQIWDELCTAFFMSIPETGEPSERGDANSGSVILDNPSVCNGSVTLTSLKDNLLRYRMWGPLSQTVLYDLFKEPLIQTSNSDSSLFWWKDFYQDEILQEIHSKQWKAWNSFRAVQSPAELPPHCVLNLTVRDPRVFLPPKKTKVMHSADCVVKDEDLIKEEGTGNCTSPHPALASSPLWDAQVRNSVREKLNEQEINKKRSELLIPGSQLELGDSESRIPVLLIQRPGDMGKTLYENTGKTTILSKPSGVVPGFASGWDIILPSGWGMAFWISLVYRGARVGGTREAESVQKECGDLYFPWDFPDTKACQLEQGVRRKQLEEKHGRYPPAKRPNFVRLGRVEPFYCPWHRLVVEWSEFYLCGLKSCDSSSSCKSVTDTCSNKAFFVLREKSKLKLLASIINGKSTDLSEEFKTTLKNAIVAVKVTMHRRGKPEKFSAICLPKVEDLKQLEESPSYGGPNEPPHKDPNKELCKKKKKGNRKRRATEGLGTEPCARVGLSGSLLGSSNRQIIGFINNGGFSLCKGFGAGIGFCAAIGLLHMKSQFWGLIRAQNSLQYRFAHVEILL